MEHRSRLILRTELHRLKRIHLPWSTIGLLRMQRGKPKNRMLDYWVGIPLLNALGIFRRRRLVPSQFQRIGVLCSPALGDTLLLSGPLQDLRAAFPAARIVHICTLQNLAAAEIIPGADERLLVNLTSITRTITQIRAQHFDVLLDFSVWQRLTAFYTMFSGAKFTVGFDTLGQHRGRGYDRAVRHSAERHELENLRALLSGSGLIPAIKSPHQPAVTISRFTPEPFEDETDPVIFHPWASGKYSRLREWPEERWIALAKRLEEDATTFFITGAPSDLPRITRLVALMRSVGLRAEPFSSQDGFFSLTRLLRRARVVVSVNTGVMHLAAIVGAPTVALNGPTAECRWGARGPNVINIQPLDGSGGYLHLGFEFKGQPEDVMERITIDQVVEACEDLTANYAGPEYAVSGRR